MRRETETLREGFTTGSAMAAAGVAAVRFLLTGECAETVEIPLPPGAQDAAARLVIPVERCERTGDGQALAEVIKDGGDDPDATHGAIMRCVVTLDASGERGAVLLSGGAGVGRVTLPGLPVAVGRAAINPDPRAQIELALAHELALHNFSGSARAVLEVPDGETIARKTMNPRLGIEGGISILGTRGTVRPYSHESWRATIAQGMSVARAQGANTIGLATGRRSERFLAGLFPEMDERAFVQIADFFAFSVKEAGRHGFESVKISCFFGKLVKMAQGVEYTHAHAAPIDFALLSRRIAEAGAGEDVAAYVAAANTARQALEILMADNVRKNLLKILGSLALEAAAGFSGTNQHFSIHVFDFDGTLLHSGERG